MKILLNMPYTATPTYGFQRAAYNLLQGFITIEDQLKSKNIELVVYSGLGESIVLQEHVISKNIRVFNYKIIPPATFSQGPQNFIRLLRGNLRDVHLVHSNDIVFTLASALAVRKPIFHTFHGFPWRAKEKTSSGYFKVFCNLWNLRNRLAIKYVNNLQYVCISPHVKRNMNAFYGIPNEKMCVIPDPVESDFFQVRKKETPGLLFYPARLVPGKNQLVLIKALAALKKKGFSKFTLSLAGGIEDVEYYKIINSLIDKYNLRKEVCFLGKVTGQDLLNLYSQASIVVVPSLNETFSLAVAEAMATGTAVVASPVGIVPDVVENGKNGYIIDPYNPIDIAEKLYLLLSDDALREKIGLAGKKLSVQWKPEKVAQALVSQWLAIS